MANKYQEAIWSLEREYVVTEYCADKIALLQELVDRDENGFSHVLSYKKDGRAYLIAFHSSQDADDFAEKNDVKNGHLSSVQFWEGYKK